MTRIVGVTLFLIACGDDTTRTNDSDTVVAETVADTVAPEVDVGCTTPPIARCRSVALALTSDAATLPAESLDDGSSASCGGTLTFTLRDRAATFDCDALGEQTVTLEVHEGDASATCDTTVEVNDAQAPTFTCKNVHEADDIVGEAELVLAELVTTSSDNCSGTLTSAVGDELDTVTLSCLSGLGRQDFEVHSRVLDASGNASAACRTIVAAGCALEGEIVDVFATDDGVVVQPFSGAVTLTQLLGTYLPPITITLDALGAYHAVPPGAPGPPVLMVLGDGPLVEGLVTAVGPTLSRRRVFLGRPDATYTLGGERVSLTLDGLAPIGAADTLTFTSFDSGTSASFELSTLGGALGSMTLEATLDVGGARRIEGPAGDVAWLVQHGTVDDAPDGVSATALVRALQLPSVFAFPSPEGPPTSVTGTLIAPDDEGTLTFAVTPSAFAALVPDGASFRALFVTHTALVIDEPIYDGGAPDLVVVRLGAAEGPLTASIAYRDPYPPGIRRATALTLLYRWTIDGKNLTGELAVEAAPDGSLTPTLTPPTAITRAGDVISWTGPGQGFVVTVYRVGAALQPVGTFTTPLSSLRLPAGLLTSGSYVVRVMARDGRARATGLSPLMSVP